MLAPEGLGPRTTVEIDGVDFELSEVPDAEADIQLVVSVPAAGAVATGDIVYSGDRLIVAGQPEPWTAALTELQASSDDFPRC